MKPKNTALLKATKKMGSQKALAEYLEIRQVEVGLWINLRQCPPKDPIGNRWTEDYLMNMEAKLACLTGLSWDEIFTTAMRENAEFLDCQKTIEQEAKVSDLALEIYATLTTDRLKRNSKGGNLLEDKRKDQINVINKALVHLSFNEKKVIKLRYGIDEDKTSTKEISHILKLTQERVRQIEDKAIRKLRDNHGK
jgi:RNA polymerase sigma factor (sigma-70 family)